MSEQVSAAAPMDRATRRHWLKLDSSTPKRLMSLFEALIKNVVKIVKNVSTIGCSCIFSLPKLKYHLEWFSRYTFTR